MPLVLHYREVFPTFQSSMQTSLITKATGNPTRQMISICLASNMPCQKSFGISSHLGISKKEIAHYAVRSLGKSKPGNSGGLISGSRVRSVVIPVVTFVNRDRVSFPPQHLCGSSREEKFWMRDVIRMGASHHELCRYCCSVWRWYGNNTVGDIHISFVFTISFVKNWLRVSSRR